MWRWTPCVALLAGLAGAGCGGDDDDERGPDGGADAGAGFEAAALAARLADALCPQLLRCCSDAELGELFAEADPPGPPADAAACAEAVTGPLGEELGRLSASVEAGRLRYRADRMDECLGLLGELTCDEFAGTVGDDLYRFPACDAPFAGAVAEGGRCAGDLDCAAGLCAGRQDGELGSCRAAPGEGEACVDGRCGEGLYCDDIGGACIAQREDGAECTGEDQCRSGACPDGRCGDGNPICDGQESARGGA
jgi:hypothetical protein